MRTALSKRTRQSQPRPQMSSRMETFPAPTRGWIRNENKSAIKAGGADILDNWFPAATGLQIRGGSARYAKISSGARIGAIIPYVAGATKKLFAADATGLYDISTSNATDNDTYTKVLLHFDGADATTTITDSNSGGSAHAWTAFGAAQLDTAASKFGGAALLCAAAGDYVSTPDSEDFALGFGDWTFDCWFNCTAAGGTFRTIVGQLDAAASLASTSFHIRRLTSNVISVSVIVGTTTYFVTGTTQFTNALNTGWHHVAVTRSGNSLRLFIDGVQEGATSTIVGSVNNSASAFAIGRLGELAGQDWVGWIDEVRLSVGVARWTENFTPPAAPYELLPILTGLTSADWQWVQFTTSAGTPFLRLVNGTDTPLVYDGSTWGTSPAITGVTAANLSHVWKHKNRLFFVEKNTMNAWYLTTDAIGGAVSKFPLGGVFKLGGALLFGATWSTDTGSGYGEKCVFVSTEGECAVYEGTDPSSAASWALEGVYRVGRPLGPRAVITAGGDLAIATDVGIVPLSQAITTDLGALGQKAISHQIEDEWAKEVAQRVGTYPWHVEMWPSKQRMVVAMPSYSSLAKICFVVNIRTGAWCRYTGWDTHCLGLYEKRLFFGTSKGEVVEAESGGSDQGASYTATCVGNFSNLGAASVQKVATLARATYITTQAIADRVSACADYIVSLPAAPSAGANVGGANAWDSAIWNQSTWSDTVTGTVNKEWAAVSAIGDAIAPAVQLTIGQAALPDITLIKIDLQYMRGVSPG